ncbi:MAG: hypothetical protein KAW12_31030 [Candidatus Aminicenantes bacterium]|nr:hypothetical protein [Candidatus Aminicenantes bacterium]
MPSDYSDVDIIKFKDAFMTSGEVIKGNEDVENYLEKIAACKKTRGWKNNVFIEVKENGDVIKIKII